MGPAGSAQSGGRLRGRSRGEVGPDERFHGPNESRGTHFHRRAGRYVGVKPGSRPRYTRGIAGTRFERPWPMGPNQLASEYDSLRFGGAYNAPAIPPGPEDLSPRFIGSADTPADAAIHPGANQRRILVTAR